MNPTPLVFTKGEHLTATKMNQLAQLAAQATSPQFSRNTGMGFKGSTNWTYPEVDVQTPANKPRNKPFDICPVWDEDGELSAYLIMRPVWYQGSQKLKLSADVSIAHQGIEDAQHIYLCELSTEQGEGEGEDQESADGKWIVIDDTQENEHQNIKSKWLLYDIYANGIVSCDYRDAFVQTGISGDATPDFTSIDWKTDDEEGEGQLSASILQIWHYEEPDGNDRIGVNGIWSNEDISSKETSAEISCEYSMAYGFIARPENGGHVKYVQLSGVLSALSTGIDTSSVSWVDREQISEQQLSSMSPCSLLAEVWHYNDIESMDKVDVNTDDGAEPISELSSYRFLARPEKGGTLKYMKLKLPSGNETLDLSSLDYVSADNDEEDGKLSAQTWHYNNLNEGDKADVVDLAHDEGDTGSDLSTCADQYRFLARPEFGGTMKYVQLSGVLSALSCDIDLSSLNWVPDNGQLRGCDKVAQIWNWESPTPQDQVTVAVSETDGYKFLARPNNGSTLKYITLSADSGGGGEVTMNGTDQTTYTGDEFTFESKTDSNVRVTITSDGKIQVGVYYV